jgi:uncharacterized protein YjiS (DUF1127 family)
MNATRHPCVAGAVRLAEIGPRPAPRRAPLLMRLADLLLGWQERARDRAQMAALSERDLRDMGLSRADVDREAAKAFWQA